MTSSRFITLAAYIALALSPAALGQYSIPWSTIDGGGAMSSSGGSYSLSGTIGQPDASSFAAPMSGGSYSLVGGFWPVAAPTCSVPGDVDLGGQHNGVDVQGFINCLLGVGGAGCACADVNGNGGVGPEDVAGFVAILLMP